MHIRKLHHYYRSLTHVKAWYFLIPAIIFALLAVYGLRDNYSKMVELREAVYVADQQNGDVESALAELRAHVHSHMNTNLASGDNAIKPPIQLKARYERLVAGEAERIKAHNAKVSKTAEQLCAQRFPGGGYNAPRVACIQDYVGANAISEGGTIPEELYKFDFISPRWSMDLAGISILLSTVFVILFAARLVLEYYLRRKFN